MDSKYINNPLEPSHDEVKRVAQMQPSSICIAAETSAKKNFRRASDFVQEGLTTAKDASTRAVDFFQKIQDELRVLKETPAFPSEQVATDARPQFSEEKHKLMFGNTLYFGWVIVLAGVGAVMLNIRMSAPGSAWAKLAFEGGLQTWGSAIGVVIASFAVGWIFLTNLESQAEQKRWAKIFGIVAGLALFVGFAIQLYQPGSGSGRSFEGDSDRGALVTIKRFVSDLSALLMFVCDVLTASILKLRITWRNEAFKKRCENREIAMTPGRVEQIAEKEKELATATTDMKRCRETLKSWQEEEEEVLEQVENYKDVLISRVKNMQHQRQERIDQQKANEEYIRQVQQDALATLQGTGLNVAPLRSQIPHTAAEAPVSEKLEGEGTPPAVGNETPSPKKPSNDGYGKAAATFMLIALCCIFLPSCKDSDEISSIDTIEGEPIELKVFITPSFLKSEGEEGFMNLADFLSFELPAGSSADLYDGASGIKITTFKIRDDIRMNDRKYREIREEDTANAFKVFRDWS